MAKKKRSPKTRFERSRRGKATASSKRSIKTSKPKYLPKSLAKEVSKSGFITAKTPKNVPRVVRPLKESAKLKRAKIVQAKPKKRNYLKTKTYKNFAKEFKRRADKKYWKEIQKEFKTLYDKKGQPLKVVMININKKFVHNTKNRMVETKKKYWGKEKWRKGKDGKWKEGKSKLRNMYRDRLRGNYVKGKAVGKRFLKIMEKDLVRKYMKKHRIKNYNKAKKKFWKEAEKKSMYSMVKLYGGSP